MAYGAILGQMPQIDGIPAVIETYPIATGNTITQGDVVDVVDGQIQKTFTPQVNVETIFNNLSVDNIHTFSTANDQIVVFFRDQVVSLSTNILSKSGHTLSADSTKNLKTSFSVETAFCKRDSTHFSFTYMSNNRMYFQNIVVSGNTSSSINLDGSEHVLWKDYTLMSINSQFCLGIDSTHFLSVFSTDGGDLVAVLCDSSSSSVPTTWKSMSLKGAARYISATRLPDSGTTRRVCVCYSDGGDSNKGKAVIVSIDGSNNVTWGSPVVFESSSSPFVASISVTYNGENIVVCYSMTNNYVFVKTLSPSNLAEISNLELGSEFKANSNTLTSGQLGKTTIVTVGPSNSIALVINDSSSGLSIGGNFVFNSSLSQYISMVAVSSTEAILSYTDINNSGYGTATILTVSGNQIAGSFLDSSKDAIALQSGTSGQSIEVVYSGTVYADWVTEGQVIDSDGVYGVGVLDGVLQVWSAERPGQIVTGSYTGTGQNGLSTQNSLSFNRQPLAVIISDNSGAYNGIFIYGSSYGPVLTGSSNYKNTLSWSANVVSWYTDSGAGPSAQLNASGTMYHYTAFLGG